MGPDVFGILGHPENHAFNLMAGPLRAVRPNPAEEIEGIWVTDKKTCVQITTDVVEAVLLVDRIPPLNRTAPWTRLSA